MYGATSSNPTAKLWPIPGKVAFRIKTRSKTAGRARLRSRHSRPTASACTTSPATYGNGARTGIGPITTSTALDAIRRDPKIASIPTNRACPNACSAAARSSAATSTARATCPAAAAKATSTRAARTSGSAAPSRPSRRGNSSAAVSGFAWRELTGLPDRGLPFSARVGLLLRRIGRRVPSGRSRMIDDQRQSVAELPLFGFQSRQQLADPTGLRWLACQIVDLVGVVLEIEKLSDIDLGIADQLPPLVAHGAL